MSFKEFREPSGFEFIALSLHDEPVVVERVLSYGASAFVLKRAATTDLIPALQEVLAGRIYVSPAARWNRQGPHAREFGAGTETPAQEKVNDELGPDRGATGAPNLQGE